MLLCLWLFVFVSVWTSCCESSSKCQTTCPGFVHLLICRSVTNHARACVCVCGFIAALHVFHVFHVLHMQRARSLSPTMDDGRLLVPSCEPPPPSIQLLICPPRLLWRTHSGAGSTCGTSPRTHTHFPGPYFNTQVLKAVSRWETSQHVPHAGIYFCQL